MLEGELTLQKHMDTVASPLNPIPFSGTPRNLSALLLKQGSSIAQARLILPQRPKGWDHSCTVQCLTANILLVVSKVLVSPSNRTTVRSINCHQQDHS